MRNDNPGGWTAHLEKRAKFPRKAGVKKPTDLDQLVERINSALQQNQELDLRSDIEKWWVFVETDGCTVELKPDLFNIVPPPDTLPPDHVFLVHQNGVVIFLQNNEIGRQVDIHFGLCWSIGYDSVDSIARYSIFLDQGETGWYVAAKPPRINNSCLDYDTSWLVGSDHSVSLFSDVVANHFLEQEGRVLALVEDCNHAIQRGQPFDFAEYIEYWQKWDKNFSIYVVPNSLFIK